MNKSQGKSALPEKLKYGVFGKKIRREDPEEEPVVLKKKTKTHVPHYMTPLQNTVQANRIVPENSGKDGVTGKQNSKLKSTLEMFSENTRKMAFFLGDDKENPRTNHSSRLTSEKAGSLEPGKVELKSKHLPNLPGFSFNRQNTWKSNRLDEERPSSSSNLGNRGSRLTNRALGSSSLNRSAKDLKVEPKAGSDRFRTREKRNQLVGASGGPGARNTRHVSPHTSNGDTSSNIRIVQPNNSMRSTSAASSFSDLVPANFSRLASAKVELPWRGSDRAHTSTKSQIEEDARASCMGVVGEASSHRSSHEPESQRTKASSYFFATDAKFNMNRVTTDAVGLKPQVLRSGNQKPNNLNAKIRKPNGAFESLTDWKKPQLGVTPILKSRGNLSKDTDNIRRQLSLTQLL